jgi:hypothetical protein
MSPGVTVRSARYHDGMDGFAPSVIRDADDGDFGDSIVQQNRTHQTLPLSGSIEVTATCPTGKRVIGGGYVAPSVLDTASSSIPEGDTGWRVEFKSNGGNGDASAYAICASVS